MPYASIGAPILPRRGITIPAKPGGGSARLLPTALGVATLIRVRDNEEESNNNSGSKGREVDEGEEEEGLFALMFEEELRSSRKEGGAAALSFPGGSEENRTCYSYRDTG